ncbi:tumor necrosis factor ligand superfamily member 6-like [Populus alba x Populus x berolinensis]|nr:tumor necrosis factor ligand superfamily member 6-like [Populus alba x Populus x berolinensis]
MAASNNLDFPYSPPPPSHSFQPPPASPHVRPPPPHIRPPPPPLPPAPSPSNNTTIIVIVFVSFGGLIFLAFLAAALCFFIKRKTKKTVEETDIVHVHEHLKVKEAIVEGPHGPKAVVLEVVDDVHIGEEIKEEEKVGEGLHAKAIKGNAGTVDQLAAPSSSGSNNHSRLEHKD